MCTIWMICGLFLIDTVIGNHASTILPGIANGFPIVLSPTESNNKYQRSSDPLDQFDFRARSTSLVPTTKLIAPRISIVDNPHKDPFKYLDPSFMTTFPNYDIYHSKTTKSPLIAGAPEFSADNAKLATTKSLPLSHISNFHPTRHPMKIHHVVAVNADASDNPHTIYPNKFQNEKFSLLNSRPLPSSTGGSLTRTPINYSPTYSDIKSIKQNPTFASGSVTNTGNFVPINLQQLQTSREIPERIRAEDIEPKPSYAGSFDKPNLYFSSIDNYQKGPGYSSPATYHFSNPRPESLENYQSFVNQPQSQFYLNNQQQSKPIYHPERFQKIRTDVEIINKKKPRVHIPKDEGTSGFEDFDKEEKICTGQQHDTSHTQSVVNFQIPNSPLFNSYDATFGKHSELSPELLKKGETVEKPERYGNKLPHKQTPVLQSDETSSSSDEYEVEGESAPSEKQQQNYENNDGYDDEFARFDKYGIDFENDFERSYQKKIPVEEFAHIKEVPDIDESVNKEKVVSRREKARGSRNTVIPAPSQNVYGYKIQEQKPKRSKSMKDNSDEQFSNAAVDDKKSVTYERPSSYIHRGGINIINPPKLRTSPTV